MIVVGGLSHRTAPIEVRERLALASDAVPDYLRALLGRAPIAEALIVSTCNRVEVVAAPASQGDLTAVARQVRAFLTERAPALDPYLYVHVGGDAVHHLFRVAASLDSLVVGEPQILGQIKQAYDIAREAGTLGGILNRVVPRAIRSAKRVRTETRIGAGQVSVPSVAVDLAAQIFGDLSSHTAALVGSGDMGETAARLLRLAGARLIVVGRNRERVSTISESMQAEGRDFSELERTLVDADVVVTTTSAPHAIVTRDQVRKNRRARRGRSLFLIDLAVPRDVEPEVGELDGVFLYNVDDLSKVVAEALSTRHREAERALSIVEEETAGYNRWAEGEQVTPLVVALREKMRRALEAEVQRSLGAKLKHLGSAEKVGLERMVEAALKKLMHGPTVKLRSMAADPALRGDLEQYLAVLQDLFALETEISEAAEQTRNVDTAGDDPSVSGSNTRSDRAGAAGLAADATREDPAVSAARSPDAAEREGIR